MADETLQKDPGVRVVALDTAKAADEDRGPHGDPLTMEQIADIAKNKDVAAIAYLWILSVVIYYHHRTSPFIRYHARQGMWLFAISIPIFLIPGIGRFLSFFTLAGMIIGFLNAAHGHYHDVPLIGSLAKGQLTLGDIGKKLFQHGRRAAEVVQRGVMPRQQGAKGIDGAEGTKGAEQDSKAPRFQDSKKGISSYLPFGNIPFLKRRKPQEDVNAEPPKEDPTSPGGRSLPRAESRGGAGDRGKAMLSLARIPVEEKEFVEEKKDGAAPENVSSQAAL